MLSKVEVLQHDGLVRGVRGGVRVRVRVSG